MNNSEYNKAENAVDNTENSLKMQLTKQNGKLRSLQTEQKIISTKKEPMMKRQDMKTGWTEQKQCFRRLGKCKR